MNRVSEHLDVQHAPGKSHEVWDRFDAATREQLLQEDLFAGRAVSGLLTAIVALGVVIGFVALFAAT